MVTGADEQIRVKRNEFQQTICLISGLQRGGGGQKSS